MRTSHEGDLHGLRLLSMPGASDEPTEALKRNTLWPKQDFIVLPLEPAMSEAIISAIGRTVPKAIIHIQIEKGGLIKFGAYDNFHPQCIFIGSAVREEVVEALISNRVIRPYTKRPHR